MGRIEECFEQLRSLGRTGLIPYVTVGYPTLPETVELVAAMVDGGACGVELGIPFSDPMADGATVQRASGVALENGVGMADCIRTAAAIRARGVSVPLIFMGYYNTFLSYGLTAFCRDAKEAGVDGVICVDLPPDEATEFLAAAEVVGLDLIFLLAPTSTDQRIGSVGAAAKGFIYCVSLAGVTGARNELPAYLPTFIGRVRSLTKLPLAVGFGISQPEHVAAVGTIADAAVVGSALIDVIDRSAPAERASAVREFVAKLADAANATSASGAR